MTAEELQNIAMEVNAISFNAAPPSDPEGPYENLTVLMGHTGLSSLTETYDDNWSTSGTTVLPPSTVIFTDVVIGDWFTIELDTPFQYDGSQNLLIEIVWSGPTPVPFGQGSLYSWSWNAGENRSVSGTSTTSPTGFASTIVQMLRIDYDPLALDQTTFAGIKASF